MPRIDDADDNIARDGETVSVRVNLVDTVRFDADGREHFVRMADEATRDARTAAHDDDDLAISTQPTIDPVSGMRPTLPARKHALRARR